MRLRGRFTPQTVTVRDIIRGGGMGDRHGDPRDVDDVWIVDAQEVIRTATGAEVISHTQVYTNIDQRFALGSLVTVWAGTAAERTGKVEQIGTFRHKRLPEHHAHYLV